MTPQEQEAANLIVESVGGAGGGGWRGRGAAGARRWRVLPVGAAAVSRWPALPQEMNAELTASRQHKTALEIRDFLSGEFTPLPLADLMAVLRARETAGTIKLAPKTGK